jgi:hypothetical protein
MARVVGLQAPVIFNQKVIPEILADSSPEDIKLVTQVIGGRPLDDLATLMLFLRPTETSRYAHSWPSRFQQACRTRQAEALLQLLQEGVTGFRELNALTPEEKSSYLAKIQDEWQQNLRCLQEAMNTGQPLKLPTKAPSFILASDQPAGMKVPCRYAFAPIELMRALGMPEPVNPITKARFAPDAVTYLQTKFAVPIKLCQA